MLAPAQIVVADSDPALSQFIIHVLERAGYAARTAPGPSAVDPAADADIVVLGGGAVAAATEGLRRRGLSAPVLVLTNGDDPAAKELAAADPRVRVLPKPFRPAALADAVATLLAGR